MPKPSDQPDTSHAFADRTGRFALDQLLRENGFRIVARPKQGQARWGRGGKVYTYKRALNELPRSLVRDVKLIQDCYYDDAYRG